MKKSVTTYPTTNRKFNANEFQKQIESFNDWERKKKEKIKQKQQEKIENEKKLLKNPKINNEANLKFNTNPKNYDAVERLYNQDLIKRKEKKIALTKIYTPTFRPFLYTNKQNLGKVLQHNNRVERKIKVYSKRHDDEYEEEESEEDEDYKNLRYKTHQNYKDKEEDDNESEEEEEYSNKKKKGRNNLSTQKKKIKMKISDDDDEEENEEENIEKIKPKKIDGKKVELKLRDLLFKNRKPLRKNK